MPNTPIFTTFFNRVKASIEDGTFAKLTLAKTMGNPELMNIYVRANVDEEELKLSLTFKFQTEEDVQIFGIDEAFAVLITYIDKPFLSALLFTTTADVTMKLNKKRVASIIEQAPTFKNTDPILLEFRSKK